MRRLMVAALCVSILSACIEDEKTRTYDEFVQEYNALQIVQDMPTDITRDLSAQDLSPEMDLASAAPDLMPDMPSVIDPDNPPECSLTGGEAVVVDFVNKTGVALDLYWYNLTCLPIKYATIAVDATYTQSTFVGHVWVHTNQFSSVVNIPARRTVIATSAMTRVELGEAP